MALTDNIDQKIQQARAAGYNDDQIRTYLSKNGIAAPASLGQSDPVEFAKGVGKGVLQTMYDASAFNAGPVGKAMLDGAPELKNKVETIIKPAMVPQNPAQKAGKTTEAVAEVVTPMGVSMAAKAAVPLMEGISRIGPAGISEAIAAKKIPEQLMQRVARVSKGKQAAFEEQAGSSIGQYLVDRGIFGTPDQIVDQLFTRFEQSKGAVDDALGELPGKFKTTAIGTALKDLLAREEAISGPGAISRDLERVRELSRLHDGQGLDMSEINEVKRLFERNIRLEYIKENAPEKIARATTLDSAIRKWQADTATQLGFKNLPHLNKETQLARQLMDDLGTEYSGSAGNNAISLTDWITLSGGTPANAAMFLTKKAATSKTIMSRVAHFLAPAKSVADPAAHVGEPMIDNYLEFLRRLER